MFSPRDILWVIVVPGLVGLLLSLAGSFLKRRAWAAPLALVVGLLITFSYVEEWAIPRIPPDPDLGFAGWITVAAAIALVAGLIDSLVRLPFLLRLLLVLIASAVSLPLLLKFKFTPDDWTRAQGAEMIAGLTAVGAVWWYCLEDVASVAPV